MLFIIDENIPFAREAFGALGEVRLVAGRAITRDLLRDADALLVRSVTRVNAALLAGTRVQFVGTATIGTDHIDLDYLQQTGISFASAAGCNANSVAEYIVAALLHIAEQKRFLLAGKTLGIVGVGNVGSRVAEKARALGLRVVLNDPPLQKLLASSTPEALPAVLRQNLSRLSAVTFHTLDELMSADIITLHTPLIRNGAHPTLHLFDENRLRKIKPGGILLNTGRGEVIDNLALKKVMRSELLTAAVLDVWENEPQIDPELLERITLATPHIAGYSFDGKVKGTWLIYEALCRFLRVEPNWDPVPFLPEVALSEIKVPASLFQKEEEAWGAQKLLAEAVCCAYDIVADDQALRKVVLWEGATPEDRGKHFDKLRHEYPIRREFFNYCVGTPAEMSMIAPRLRKIGFQIAAPAVRSQNLP